MAVGDSLRELQCDYNITSLCPFPDSGSKSSEVLVIVMITVTIMSLIMFLITMRIPFLYVCRLRIILMAIISSDKWDTKQVIPMNIIFGSNRAHVFNCRPFTSIICTHLQITLSYPQVPCTYRTRTTAGPTVSVLQASLGNSSAAQRRSMTNFFNCATGRIWSTAVSAPSSPNWRG